MPIYASIKKYKFLLTLHIYLFTIHIKVECYAAVPNSKSLPLCYFPCAYIAQFILIQVFMRK